MSVTAYYNEFDPFAAAWLRELIKAGHITRGDVDTRSIEDVVPTDLAGYSQCHFFAGIGVWSYALRQAGWPDDRPVWTGSCPCQPFSSAGKRDGFTDERHLWPAFFHLIRECHPDIVFGEQVASKDGLAWSDLVRSDLEATGYAVGLVDTCAAGFGAPHIRQRLYWVAHAIGQRPRGRRDGDTRGMLRAVQTAGRSTFGGLAYPNNEGLEGRERVFECTNKRAAGQGSMEIGGFSGKIDGFWRNADWLYCRDGRWRPVEPGTFPLADEPTARVGRLRGYGNALCAKQAEAFIKAYMEEEL